MTPSWLASCLRISDICGQWRIRLEPGARLLAARF